MHSSCIQFADDTSIYCSGRNLRYLKWQITEDLGNISDWFKANKLTLNLNKTNYMIFNPKPNEPIDTTIYFKSTAIPRVHNTKFLGIWLDDQLNWKCHLTHLHLKLKSNLSLLKRSKHILIPSTKTILYYAQIFGHLNYGILCWGSMINQSDCKSIEKIQNQCISLIDPKLNTHEIYKTHNLLKLQGLIELSILKFGYQFDQGYLPKKIMESITCDHKNDSLIKTHHYRT